MTPQEQSNLDRVFGRIHIQTAKGGLRPLNPDPTPVEEPTRTVDKVKTKHVVVAVVAPKQETSPLLRALKSTLPPPEDFKVTSRPADAPKDP